MNAGLVETWNKKNPDMAVMPGDRLVDVNGIHDDLLQLFEECKTNKMLTMTFVVGNGNDGEEVATDQEGAATGPSSATAGGQSSPTSGGQYFDDGSAAQTDLLAKYRLPASFVEPLPEIPRLLVRQVVRNRRR